MLRPLPRGVSNVLVGLQLQTRRSKGTRTYATVSSSIIAQTPHSCEETGDDSDLPLIDRHILAALSRRPPTTTLPDIIKQYIALSGTVLDVSLKHQTRPTAEAQRPSLKTASKEVVTVAHCATDGTDRKITFSSGFALDASASREGESLILTCAHTLEEIRQSPLLLSNGVNLGEPSPALTGTFIVVGSRGSLALHPVSGVVSALPRSDLLLLSCKLPRGALNTLYVSPYPAHKDTAIRAHFVTHREPKEPGWSPWIGDTWGKWAQGKVLGYRDFAGREAEPGTYDALSHLMFTPLPTVGSSGGPILDEESGAVVGVMLGTRMDNRVEGVRGWGVPSEAIFEMFTLPGLEGKK